MSYESLAEFIMSKMRMSHLELTEEQKHRLIEMCHTQE